MRSILCIESATHQCSVAFRSADGEISARNLRGEGYIHAEKLHVLISEVLGFSACRSSAELRPGHRPDAIAVSEGPGSYTGLRIGVAAAKGLCFAYGVPLISVGTLEHMARGMALRHPGYDHYVPLLDARRMEVYTATYDASGICVDAVQAHILDDSSFTHLSGKKLFFGDAVEKVQDFLGDRGGTFEKDVWPNATDMLTIAEEKLLRNDQVSLVDFEPYYLKDFVSGPTK